MKKADDKAEGGDAVENIAEEAKPKDDDNVNVSSCTNETDANEKSAPLDDSCVTPSTFGKFLRFIAHSLLEVFDY